MARIYADFQPAWCSRQDLLVKQALSQILAIVHKAIEMAFYRSRRKTVIFGHLYTKMFKNCHLLMQNNAFFTLKMVPFYPASRVPPPKGRG